MRVLVLSDLHLDLRMFFLFHKDGQSLVGVNTPDAPSSFGDQRQRLTFTEAEALQYLRHPRGPGQRAAGFPFPDGQRRHLQKLRDLQLCEPKLGPLGLQAFGSEENLATWFAFRCRSRLDLRCPCNRQRRRSSLSAVLFDLRF